MGNVTRQEIVVRMSEKTGLTQIECEEILLSALRAIGDHLVNGDTIELRGFGRFSTKELISRVARNPKNGELVVVRQHRAPRFKPSKFLTRAIMEGHGK